MPQWKTISQRNFLKGLQATYSRFAQPGAILVRLSNLLYDRRGGLRTTDGSGFVTGNITTQPSYGPIIDLALYSPPGVNAYLVGIEQGTLTGQGLASGITLSQITVGGTIANITRQGGIVTVQTTAAHNLGALATLNGRPFNPGYLVIAGSAFDFNGNIPWQSISIVNATTISYPQNGTDGESSTAGTLGTQLAPGAYTYNVTACDGIGGESPGQFGGGVSITVTAPNNAVIVTWTAGILASLFSVYETVGARFGRINPGPGAPQAISGTTFADIGQTAGPGQTPPTSNSTGTCQIYLMPAGTFQDRIATVPPYVLPSMGGIPGSSAPSGSTAGAGPTPQGGIVGATSPLPQISQFTGRLAFALGNGYPPQQYTDPSIDGTGFQGITNSFSSQYPDWQASVAWNQGDQIKDSGSGGVFQAMQTGSSGAARPAFVNTLNATTAETTGTLIWKCIATKITPTALRGAAHGIVYAGSLWLANTSPTTTTDLLDGPNVVKMSDVNTLTSWNPLNIAFIAKDDGDQITALGTFTIAESGISPTGSLVVFKNFTTYQITGVFGASDFAIQQAQTDLGCIAPRSLQFVPGFGLMRMTHLGFAYFNGVADKLVSEEIRPYLFGGPSDIQPVNWNYIWFAKGAQAANPPMYVCAVPIQAPALAGAYSVVPPFPGSGITMYALLTKLQLDSNGFWTETNASAEITLKGTTQSAIVTSPPAQTNVKYRIYLGFVAGGENRYQEAASFTNFVAAYSTMTPGVPSIGTATLRRLICYDLVQRSWAILDVPFPISAIKQIRAPGTVPLTLAGGYSDGIVRRMFAGDISWDTAQSVEWSFTTAEIFQEGGSGKVFYRRITARGEESSSASIQVSVMLGGKQQPAITAQQKNLGTTQWVFVVDIMQDAMNANATVSGTGPMEIQSLDWQVKPKPTGAPVSIQK